VLYNELRFVFVNSVHRSGNTFTFIIQSFKFDFMRILILQVLDAVRLWLHYDAHSQEQGLATIPLAQLVRVTSSVCSVVAECHFVFENRSKSSVITKLVNVLRSILTSLLDSTSSSARRVAHYAKFFGPDPSITLANLDVFWTI
jgi:hypothetical protein